MTKYLSIIKNVPIANDVYTDSITDDNKTNLVSMLLGTMGKHPYHCYGVAFDDMGTCFSAFPHPV